MSTRIRIFALAAVLTALTSLVGCAGGGGGDSGDSATPADPAAGEALSSSGTLSQDLICAAVKAADDSNEGDGLKTIAQGDLKGDALKDFKAFQKGETPDFPSQAFTLPVKLGSKTTNFIMVIESNDGGQTIGVYQSDGTNVSTVSNGESDPGKWSKPADKCPL